MVLVSPAPPSLSPAASISFATNAVWVESAGTTTASAAYAYDSAGNTTNLNGAALEWDERYRLKSVDVDDVSSFVAYEYDALNRRVSRTEGASVERYIYSGNQVVADLDGSGTLLRSYVWGPGIDNLLSFTDHASSITYYAIKDHQNTILAFVDSSGAPVESYEYDAYGRTKVYSATGTELTASAVGNRYTFQGREIDWTTGLTYFRARWYNPETGRWLSKDPIGIAGGLNLYVFCGSNPVNRIDPNGFDFVHIYSTDSAFGISGAHHIYIVDPTGKRDPLGRNGSSSSNLGQGGGDTSKDECVGTVELPDDMSIDDFFDYFDEHRNDGLYFLWINDCHSSILTQQVMLAHS